MTEKKFTSDWFSWNIPLWEKILQNLKGKPNLNFLEIGTYEGRSAIWLLENILTDKSSKIHCIDIFDGNLPDNNFELEPHLNLNKNYYETFLENIQSYSSQVIIYKGYSYEILRNIKEIDFLDFVYIDGAHTAYETLSDAVYIDPMLKKGGLIIFDDYSNQVDPNIIENNPKLGIDAFCQVFSQQYEKIHVGYSFPDWQLVLKKINDVHIV